MFLSGQLESCIMEATHTQSKESVKGPRSICMSLTGKGLLYIPMPNRSVLEASAGKSGRSNEGAGDTRVDCMSPAYANASC